MYFEPEKHGLELVAEADYADAYEFNIFAVWRHKETGKILYATDSG